MKWDWNEMELKWNQVGMNQVRMNEVRMKSSWNERINAVEMKKCNQNK